jgi:uncharacterized membrane protein YjjP (DUF1212 family)
MTQDMIASQGPAGVPSGPRTLAGPARNITWEEMTDVIDLALWTGQILLEHGAPAPRVEETVMRVGTGLGADDLDILVSPNVIMVTTTEGREFRTKARRIAGLHVNMAAIVQMSALTRDVTSGRIGRVQLRERLTSLEQSSPGYRRWHVAAAVGLACAAFSRLFGGDWTTFALVLVASAAGMAVRQTLVAARFNPYLNAAVTSFFTTTVVALATLFVRTGTPQHALAASVLLLVPGVPLINAFEELVKGHALIAVSRGVQGLIISLAIALGLMLGMNLVGVRVL